MKKKIYRREKTEGEHISFFFWHNFIAVGLFFIIMINLGIFDITDIELSYILSWSFAETIIWVFIISFCVDIAGRFIAYFLIIRPFSKYVYKRDCKGFREISTGINRFSYKTIITLLLSSFLFSIGALYLIGELLFEENTIWALIFTYAILKIGIFLIVKLFIK